jgi:hypothetical protein
MKFITTSNDPSSYGSEFDPDDLGGLNERIESAARLAGIDIIQGDPHITTRMADERREQGDDEIDWFAQWCATGYRYSTRQWAAWFRRQMEVA